MDNFGHFIKAAGKMWRRGLIQFLLLFPKSPPIRAGLSLALLCLAGFSLSADEPPPKSISDQEFKAALLSKIPTYVRWPESSFIDPHTFTIGVWGDDSTEKILDRLMAGTAMRDRKVRVIAVDSPTNVCGCQLVFVSTKAETNWFAFTSTNGTFGILSAGENQRFIDKGGVFSLLSPERKLVVHRVHAEKAGLKINSKLLQISIVEP